MKLRHAGVGCRSEANADRFFRDVLGMKKSEPRTVERELSRALFDVDAELKMIHYVKGDADVEVFIAEGVGGRSRGVGHVCLEVEELGTFLERCREAGVKVIQAPKGESVVTFIRDGDDNLYEIKEG